MKQRTKRLATSLTEKFVSFIACETFKSGWLMRHLMHFLTISGLTELDLTIVADNSTTWTASECNSGFIESIGHRNATILLCFGGCQMPKMARSIWMARKFNGGVTYQCKAKNMVNVQEYLYGVANVVTYHYNE